MKISTGIVNKEHLKRMARDRGRQLSSDSIEKINMIVEAVVGEILSAGPASSNRVRVNKTIMERIKGIVIEADGGTPKAHLKFVKS